MRTLGGAVRSAAVGLVTVAVDKLLTDVIFGVGVRRCRAWCLSMLREKPALTAQTGFSRTTSVRHIASTFGHVVPGRVVVDAELRDGVGLAQRAQRAAAVAFGVKNGVGRERRHGTRLQADRRPGEQSGPM